MGALPLAAAGVGLGAIENNQKVAEYNRQKELASQMQRYSPWTGVGGESYMPKAKPNLFNSMLQGGMQGAAFGMGLPGEAAANPMAGATQIGGNPGTASAYQGMNQMAGGFESPIQKQSSWLLPNYNSPMKMTT